MYSFVVKMAIDVNRAVLVDIMIPTLGIKTDIVLLIIVETTPNNISEINIFTLFSFNSSHFFLQYSLSISKDFKNFHVHILFL